MATKTAAKAAPKAAPAKDAAPKTAAHQLVIDRNGHGLWAVSCSCGYRHTGPEEGALWKRGGDSATLKAKLRALQAAHRAEAEAVSE